MDPGISNHVTCMPIFPWQWRNMVPIILSNLRADNIAYISYILYISYCIMTMITGWIQNVLFEVDNIAVRLMCLTSENMLKYTEVSLYTACFFLIIFTFVFILNANKSHHSSDLKVKRITKIIVQSYWKLFNTDYSTNPSI